MKRRMSFLCICVLLVISGCKKEDYGSEGFDRATDFQYQYASDNGNISLNIQAMDEEGNLYFIKGNTLMKLDEKMGDCYPLCDKAGCLHDKETDDTVKQNCNAYIGINVFGKSDVYENSSLFYYKGKIYVAYHDWDEINNCHLSVISTDGHSRDDIYDWTSNSNYILLHRGWLYYSKTVIDEDGINHATLERVNVENPNKVETVADREDMPIVYEMAPITAYGKYVYINAEYSDSIEGEDDYLNHYFNKTYAYDIETEELIEIKPQNIGQTEVVDSIMIYDGKVLFTIGDLSVEESIDTTKDIYECSLDGSDVDTYMTNIPYYRNFYSDGEHLFISNCNEVMYATIFPEKVEEFDIDTTKVHTEVYDKNRELIDTFVEEQELVDDASDIRIGIGDYRYQFILDEDLLGGTLYQWDKTEIGNLKGAMWNPKVVFPSEG